MRISDWSSDVCSSDLLPGVGEGWTVSIVGSDGGSFSSTTGLYTTSGSPASVTLTVTLTPPADSDLDVASVMPGDITFTATAQDPERRSEEHTSELQSLMRISYAVFCLKTTNKTHT